MVRLRHALHSIEGALRFTAWSPQIQSKQASQVSVQDRTKQVVYEFGQPPVRAVQTGSPGHLGHALLSTVQTTNVERRSALQCCPCRAAPMVAAPASDATALPKYSLREVAAHSSPTDCWLVIHGKVYDVTSWRALRLGAQVRCVAAPPHTRLRPPKGAEAPGRPAHLCGRRHGLQYAV